MNIAAIISKRLEDRGLNQSELARRLGVGRSAVHFWCNGVNKPKMNRLPLLARELGMEVRDFF